MAIAAAICPGCGEPAPAAKGGGWIALASLAIVALIAWGIYALIFAKDPPPSLFAGQQLTQFNACVSAIRNVDPDATVKQRRNFGSGNELYVAWPAGGTDFVVHGVPTSGACTVDAAGNVTMLLIDGKDVI